MQLALEAMQLYIVYALLIKYFCKTSNIDMNFLETLNIPFNVCVVVFPVNKQCFKSTYNDRTI